MALTMYDSTTPVQSIPKDATLIAAYVTGFYGMLTPDVRAAFPGATFISVDATGSDPTADVVDCETGDATPTGAAQWCRKKLDQKLGSPVLRRPCVYCSTSLYSAVAAALQSVGLAFGTDVDWWEAHYDGVASVSNTPGAVAKQYQSDSAANLDTSVVLASWLAHVPSPTPSAAPTQEEHMGLAVSTVNGVDVIIQVGVDGTVWAKARSGAQTWQQAQNKAIAKAIVGTSPVARVAGTAPQQQLQVFIEEASDLHVEVLASSDGVNFGQAELP